MNIGNRVKIRNAVSFEIPKGKLSKKSIEKLRSQIEVQIFLLRHGLSFEEESSDRIDVCQAIIHLESIKKTIEGIIPAREQALREFIFGGK